VLKTFRLTFLEETAVSREVHRYLRIYCEKTGMNPRALKPLLRFYLLTRFPRLASRQLGQLGKTDPPEELAVTLHRSLADSCNPVFAR